MLLNFFIYWIIFIPNFFCLSDSSRKYGIPCTFEKFADKFNQALISETKKRNAIKGKSGNLFKPIKFKNLVVKNVRSHHHHIFSENNGFMKNDSSLTRCYSDQIEKHRLKNEESNIGAKWKRNRSNFTGRYKRKNLLHYDDSTSRRDRIRAPQRQKLIGKIENLSFYSNITQYNRVENPITQIYKSEFTDSSTSKFDVSMSLPKLLTPNFKFPNETELKLSFPVRNLTQKKEKVEIVSLQEINSSTKTPNLLKSFFNTSITTFSTPFLDSSNLSSIHLNSISDSIPFPTKDRIMEFGSDKRENNTLVTSLSKVTINDDLSSSILNNMKSKSSPIPKLSQWRTNVVDENPNLDVGK